VDTSGVRMSDLREGGAEVLEETARLLVAAFSGYSSAWPDLEAARAEVRESLDGGGANRIARDASGRLVGWIGAIPQYDGRVWELHPVAVLPEAQRAGVGRRLLVDIERLAADQDVLTLWLGADDETGRTSLAGLDPYPDPLSALASIANIDEHPFEFYQKCGYSLVGIVPDANGLGKPDILLAKRVGRQKSADQDSAC
jgi:aminoglycoside 6'-N-acetyltransferase I